MALKVLLIEGLDVGVVAYLNLAEVLEVESRWALVESIKISSKLVGRGASFRVKNGVKALLP